MIDTNGELLAAELEDHDFVCVIEDGIRHYSVMADNSPKRDAFFQKNLEPISA